jgi:hypothetical protein
MPSPKDLLDKAYQEAVASIAHDVPLLMHGAGDVDTSNVDGATARLVAALTVEYMQKLTDAALDSHQMLLDSVTTCPLPPPQFVRSRKPPVPPPPPSPVRDSKEKDKKDKAGNTVAEALPPKKKQRRATDEFWDEPLPAYKIKGQPSTNPSQSAADEDSTVHVDKWVGLAGVDLLEHRARSAYVQGPAAALSTQSFIFPVCHDVYTYARIIEAQAVTRSLMPLLVDPVLAELVRVEGKQEHKKKPKKKKKSGNTSDPEEDDGEASAEEDDGEVPCWPGLEDILPVYRNMY